MEEDKHQPSAETKPQKYLLHRRNSEGHLIKVETFDKPLTPEEVLEKFGPGYYILKATKPRFSTVWKELLGDGNHSEELRRVKKDTRNLMYGFAILGVGEVAGFGLTHLRFSGLEKQVDTIKTIVKTRLKAEGLQCGNCGKPLDFFLQDFCSQCGIQIDWPRKLLPTEPTGLQVECLNCKSPLLKHQIYCPHCGHERPILVSSKSAWLPFHPPNWGDN